MKVPLLLAALTLVAAPVAAQSLEVAGGYSMGQLVIPNSDYTTFPTGWFGSIALPVVAHVVLAVVADANFQTIRTEYAFSSATTQARHLAVLAGPRTTTLLIGPVNLFGEVLVGVMNSGFRATVIAQPSPAFVQSDYVTNAVWQPGGGVDIQLAKHVAARIELGERILLLHPMAEKSIQIATGLVFTR